MVVGWMAGWLAGLVDKYRDTNSDAICGARGGSGGSMESGSIQVMGKRVSRLSGWIGDKCITSSSSNNNSRVWVTKSKSTAGNRFHDPQ